MASEIDENLQKAQQLLDGMMAEMQEFGSIPFKYAAILPEWLPAFQQLANGGLLSPSALDALLDEQEPGVHRNRIFIEMRDQARLVALEQGGVAGSLTQQEQIQEDNLTPRQKEVAHCLALGLSDEQIAAELFIAIATAKKHRQNIKPQWAVSTEDTKALQDEARRRGYGKGQKDTLKDTL